MIVDPEQVVEQRRARSAPAAEPIPADELGRTRVALERERADDPMAMPRIWLARWRGDRHDLAQIAADENLDVAQIRAGIDRAARAEGTTFADLEAIRNRPPRRLGQAKQPRLVGS